MAKRERAGKRADEEPGGLSPRIEAAVSHFVRNPPHRLYSASSRPPRPPRRDRDGGRDHDAGSASSRDP